MLKKVWEAIGGRKLLFSLICLGVITTMTLLGRGTDAYFTAVVALCLGFCGSNMLIHKYKKPCEGENNEPIVKSR